METYFKFWAAYTVMAVITTFIAAQEIAKSQHDCSLEYLGPIDWAVALLVGIAWPAALLTYFFFMLIDQ